MDPSNAASSVPPGDERGRETQGHRVTLTAVMSYNESFYWFIEKLCITVVSLDESRKPVSLIFVMYISFHIKE